MKLLMLGRRNRRSVLSTLGRILELEKVEYSILFIDECSEEELIRELKNSELFLMYPESFRKDENDPETSGFAAGLMEAVAAGYLIANKGHFLIFTHDPPGLSGVFYGEPVVGSIGEAIGYFRRERKIFESNKVMLEARQIISDSHLSFNSKGFVEAVEYGLYKECQAFLKAGFSTETENINGVPLLNLAVRNGDIELCRLLMSYGASLNVIARDRCTSPVMDAVTAVKTEIAELLIDGGADLNFKNRNGQSALIVAIGSRMEEIAELLIDREADISSRDSLGMTAADYARLFSLTNIQRKLESGG